jgi:predicted Zn-dependent protease
MCEHHAMRPESADGDAVLGQLPQGALVNIDKLDRRALIRALATGSLVVLASSCATNPETGRSQFTGLASEQMMAAMALQSWEELRQTTPAWRNPRAQARLANVGQQIALAANRPADPWEFVVFDSDELNAFVLPGGKVGFYRGLMEIAERDDHIATVVGHEVGHVTGRHAAERFSQAMAAQGLMIGAQLGSRDMDPQTRSIALGALGLGATVGLLLPFSRLQEAEADRLGVDYMYRAGYDVRETISFWRRMNELNDGPRPPSLLSTHPDPSQRVQELRNYINTRGYALV